MLCSFATSKGTEFERYGILVNTSGMKDFVDIEIHLAHVP